MKVVFDTNIIVSGLYSKSGASYQLLRAAISGKLSFAVSPLVALEYEGIIHQKINDGFLKVLKKDFEKILDSLLSKATIVWKPLHVRPILPDTSDDKILECAISGNCTHIITFNKKHFPLTAIAPYRIKVVTAGEFIEIWRVMP